MEKPLSRFFRDVVDEDFSDIYREDEPIIPQIEAFAAKHSISLEQGWKVVLAMNVKQLILKSKTDLSEDIVKKWVELFNKFNN